MIDMQVYRTGTRGTAAQYRIVATVPGVYNPSGTLAVWTIEGFGDLQSLMNRLAAKVAASKPFPKW